MIDDTEAILRQQRDAALDILQAIYADSSITQPFTIIDKTEEVRKLFAETRPEVLTPTKEPTMTPEEIDEAIAEIVDEMLELREKAQLEPWADVNAYVEDMKRRLLAKMDAAAEDADGGE